MEREEFTEMVRSGFVLLRPSLEEMKGKRRKVSERSYGTTLPAAPA